MAQLTVQMKNVGLVATNTMKETFHSFAISLREINKEPNTYSNERKGLLSLGTDE